MGLQLGPSLPVALLFAAVHVLGRVMDFLRSTPRSAWLSAAGGVSVAYVFVHLLPELAEHQGTVSSRVDEAVAGGILGGIERHVCVVALAGLAVFHGLDRFARSSARRRGPG